MNFSSSSGAQHKLKNYQKQMALPDLKLIQECKTRWNSAFQMMERILKLKERVLSTLAITNNDLNCIPGDEWQVVSSACTFLNIFHEVTTEMSTENVVTISKQNFFYMLLLDYLHKYIFDINMQQEIISMAAEIKAIEQVLQKCRRQRCTVTNNFPRC